MSHILRSIITKTTTAVGMLSGLALLFTGFILFIEVVLRYLGQPTDWIAETSVYLFAAALLLGSSYTLMRDRHVRVELLIERFSPKIKNICYLITSLIGAIFCAFVVRYAWIDLMDVIETGETTATTLRVPLWLTEMPLCIGFALMGIQFLLFAYDRLCKLRQGTSDKSVQSLGENNA